jgi:hypothetical protein
MGVVIDKPKWVTMSKWDVHRLSREQVNYACIDAFTSYEVVRLWLSNVVTADTTSTLSVASSASVTNSMYTIHLQQHSAVNEIFLPG